MYIDAIFDRKNDKILVAERHNGKREFTEFPVDYKFYYTHPQGGHVSIFGDACKMYSTGDGQKFRKELSKIVNGGSVNRKPVKVFEGDLDNTFSTLYKNYKGVEAPTLNIGFFDIEVGFDTKKGYAPTDDPFNAITAISVYMSQVEKLVTLVLCPPTLTMDEAQAICDDFDDTYVFDDEITLLEVFLDLIDDVDVLSGWNSKGFDIPYIVNRVIRLIGRDATKKMCLWGREPRKIEYRKFNKIFNTYELVGRVHLDYLDLYQKHAPKRLHSYKLDFVGEIEVGENKIPYEGNLDDLYKKDFKKFVEYNRQDTLLLYKIDKKKKYIELSNQVAHGNGVLLKTTLGSVALVEAAIINEMHEMGFVVPQKKIEEEENIYEVKPAASYFDDEDDEIDYGPEEDLPVVGAYVATPKAGIHQEIGCVDINSLYPSAIRSLNMSPETIFGHIRPIETEAYIRAKLKTLNKAKKAEAWEGIFATFEYSHIMAKDGAAITIDFEDGRTETKAAREWYKYIFDPANQLCITANGTLFKTNKDGTIPRLLAKWYSERKTMQGREKTFTYVMDPSASVDKTLESSADEFISEIEAALKDASPSDIDAGKFIKAILKKDAKTVAEIMVTYGFIIDGNSIKASNEKDAKYWTTFWNQRQQARKILLNSLYGALLNRALRFYDERLGQSVTLTGRSIVKHMNSKINEIIVGEYNYCGDAIIYSDTDSSYFTAYHVLKDNPDFDMTRENIIVLYDSIADEVNKSFPDFMHRTFNTSLDRGAVIAAGRELIGSKGLFIKKKKYAVLVYDKEGKRTDIDKQGNPVAGELKIMGLDLKRSDTPKYMQVFLEELLLDTLTDVDKEEIFDKIRAFRKTFTTKPGWEKGAPKAVNGLSDYKDRTDDRNTIKLGDKKAPKKRFTIPEHVLASMNWNKLCEMNDDKYSARIGDGAKIIVVKIKPNPTNMTSVAYPIDEPHIPEWFKKLPFDHKLMEETIIDKKLNNLFGVLKWDFTDTKEKLGTEFFKF